MSLSMKARLITIVLAATTASLAGAEDLRGPDTFSSLSNPSERARALFVEAGRVLQHPRCLNCHPVGEYNGKFMVNQQVLRGTAIVN